MSVNKFSSEAVDRALIIAEVGGNHNGDFQKALEMISAAKKCDVDMVKFQIYVPEKLVHHTLPPLPILKGRYGSQLERFKSLTFDDGKIIELANYCAELEIEFLATPFDTQSADLLEPLVRRYKVASGDINNVSLIRYLLEKNKPLIISTGMATVDEIDRIYSLVPRDNLALLHCVSLYPTPYERANLKAIAFLKQRYPDVPIGYSDHTIGNTACLGAVGLGAKIIEKHFTFDKSIPYGDHCLSADYHDMKILVEQIRQMERMIGDGKIERSEEELEKRTFFRRGVYASRDILKGEMLKIDDISLVRPPTEISADEIDLVINRVSMRNILKGDPILWEDLSS